VDGKAPENPSPEITLVTKKYDQKGKMNWYLCIAATYRLFRFVAFQLSSGKYRAFPLLAKSASKVLRLWSLSRLVGKAVNEQITSLRFGKVWCQYQFERAKFNNDIGRRTHLGRLGTEHQSHASRADLCDKICFENQTSQ
jgi:hypothetical protein